MGPKNTLEKLVRMFAFGLLDRASKNYSWHETALVKSHYIMV